MKVEVKVKMEVNVEVKGSSNPYSVPCYPFGQNTFCGIDGQVLQLGVTVRCYSQV